MSGVEGSGATARDRPPAAGSRPVGPAASGAARLAAAFVGPDETDRPAPAAFIPYLTHGFPDPGRTPRLLESLAEAGADVIELGVPFSDPLADGPTIQEASWRALEHGVTLDRTLSLVEEMAADLPPLVLFSYLNPILRMGVERFTERAAAAGAAGVLVTDLPVGSDPGLERRLVAGGVPLIRLIAPTTTDERIGSIAGDASGFLYYISRTGVTGEREALDATLGEAVRALRRRVRLPVAVGFGISRPDQAAEVAAVADGVVVGSALISALDRGEEAFTDLAASLARAVHEAGGAA